MADSTAYDLSPIQGLLAQLQQYSQPTQADQDAARKQALIAAGLGLLGTRRGREAAGLGHAGLLGLETYQQGLQQSEQRRHQAMSDAASAMQLQNAYQQFKDTQGSRQVLQDFYAKQGMPGQLPPDPSAQPPAQLPASSFGMQDRGLGAMPTSPSVPLGPSPTGGMPSPTGISGAVPPKAALYRQYEQLSQELAAKGYPIQAKQYMDMAQTYRPKLFKTEEGTDPVTKQRVQINYYDDGTHEILRDVGAPAKEAKMVDTGSVIGAVDPFTGQPIAGGGLYNKTMTPGEVATNQVAQGNLKVAQGNLGVNNARLAEETRYHNLELGGIGPDGQPANVEGVAQAIANYKQPPLSSFAMSKPIGSAIMSKVMELNPTYDAQQYATRLKAGQAFSAGKEAQTTRSIGVALQHLDVLGQAADALDNGNLPMLNQLSNVYKTQTGQPGPTNFASTKQIVANEIVKSIIGAGGGVEDRKRAAEAVSAASSPAQLKGVIGQYKQLMAGQLQGLRQQYEASGNTDFDKYLPAEAQALVGGGSDIRSKADAILRGGK